MTVLHNNIRNFVQGAQLRSQIAGARADGRVTTAEANALIARARQGGVQPSELAALRELAQSSRGNNSFDAGAKAALNNFLGRSADASHASGRLPPAANLPQRLGFTDRARLSALDAHFKKDDGRIGRSEMQRVLRNIFKDGNLSSTERSYLTAKLRDPNVSADAKSDIRLILSLVPGGRLPIGGGGCIRPPWPRQLPPQPQPQPAPSDLTARYAEQMKEFMARFTSLQSKVDGLLAKLKDVVAGGNLPPNLSQPTPPKDPKDLAALNRFAQDLVSYIAAALQHQATQPTTGGTGSTGTGGTAPSSGTSPSAPAPSSGSTSPTSGSGGPTYNGGFPAYPTPPKDPKDLAAQNKYQEDMYAFQHAQQQMNTFWTTMQNALKSMGEVAMGAARNLR
ncbi:MAG: hypothetical protein JNJ54_31405 [Myxococcaceae bacterium]|nr:hypothetical protein [Myxococcaceae bacterium]